MKLETLLNSKPVQVAAAVAVGALAIYWIGKRAGGAIGNAFADLGGAVKRGASAVGSAVNPASDRNLIYRANSATLETLSGGRVLSLGDFVYQLTHGELFGGKSASIQDSSNKPYQRASSSRTADAARSSPLRPEYKESTYAQGR